MNNSKFELLTTLHPSRNRNDLIHFNISSLYFVKPCDSQLIFLILTLEVFFEVLKTKLYKLLRTNFNRYYPEMLQIIAQNYFSQCIVNFVVMTTL